MSPDQLFLPPTKLSELAQDLAGAGLEDPIQSCIDEAAAVVADYVAGYTLSTTRTEGWTRSIALWIIYTRSSRAVPEKVKEANDQAMSELRDVREGKFNAEQDSSNPVKSGAAITGSMAITTRMS
jgi:hypothetical protein